jgi:hypothetical protein
MTEAKFTGHGYALLDTLQRLERARAVQFGSDERFTLGDIIRMANAAMVHYREYEDLIALGLIERAGKLIYPRSGALAAAYRITEKGRREFAKGHPGAGRRVAESGREDG